MHISLYCLLDWICFRELVDLTLFSNLIEFHRSYSQHTVAQQTDPRI